MYIGEGKPTRAEKNDRGSGGYCHTPLVGRELITLGLNRYPDIHLLEECQEL